MKKLISLIVFLYSVFGLWNLEMVFAQSKIGYIDSQKILSTYPAAIDAQKKLETENEQWDKELQKMSKEFKSLQDEIEQQSLLLSEAKKREKAQELENMAMKIQQFQAQKWGETGEYFKRREAIMKPVIDQINQAIHRVGEEEDYDFILDSVAGNILHAKEQYDVTDQVLNELEKGVSSE